MAHLVMTVVNDVNYDKRMQRICTTLSNAGYEVTLIGRKRYYSVSLRQRPFEQKRLTCWWNKGKLFYLEYNLRLFFYLLWHSFDVVCSVDMDTLLPGYCVAKLKRKICVYDAHEYFSQVPELTHRPITRSIWKGLERWLIPRVYYKYTVNRSLAQLMEERLSTRFAVIRNVPRRASSASPPSFELPSSPFLFYQGVINVGRGLPQLITALQELDIPLYLAGEGDIKEELQELVRARGLTDQVTFLGFVEPSRLLPWMEKATIGINLIENRGISYYYSLANKFFDYIHAQLPQITMNFPEYRRINEDYEVALLLEGWQAPTIRNAIRKLLADEAYYTYLAENCKKAKEQYNWEKESEKLLRFYNNMPLPNPPTEKAT